MSSSPLRVPPPASKDFHSEASLQARLYYGGGSAGLPAQQAQALREVDRANLERRLARDLAATQERILANYERHHAAQEAKDNAPPFVVSPVARRGYSADFSFDSQPPHEGSPLRRGARCVVAGCSFEPVGGGGRGFCAVHSASSGDGSPVRVVVRPPTRSEPVRAASPSKLPAVHFLTGSLGPSSLQTTAAAANIGLTLPALPHSPAASPKSHARTQIIQAQFGQNSGSNTPSAPSADDVGHFLATSLQQQLASPYKLSSSRPSGQPVQYSGEETQGHKLITPSPKNGPRGLQPAPPPSTASPAATPSRSLRTPAGLALSYEHGRNIKGLRKEVLYSAAGKQVSSSEGAPSTSSSSSSSSSAGGPSSASPLIGQVHVHQTPLQPLHSPSSSIISLPGTLNRASVVSPPTSARNSATSGALAPLSSQFDAVAAKAAEPTAATAAPSPSPVIVSSVSSASSSDKPLTAVQRQRAYRAALLSKALSKPSTVSSLDRQRLDALKDLLTKRMNLETLLKKKIVIGEADAAQRRAVKEDRRASLAHLLTLRPSATTLANKNILRPSAVGTAGDPASTKTQKTRDKLGAFFAKRPSLMEVQDLISPPQQKSLLSQLGHALKEEQGDEPSDQEGDDELPDEPQPEEEHDEEDGEHAQNEGKDTLTPIERTFRKFPALTNTSPFARRPSLAPGGRKFSVFTSERLATSSITALNKLSSFLETRPHYDDLLKKNIIMSKPGSAFHSNPTLAANARKMSFSNLRSSVSKLLHARPTMLDLKHMAKDLLGKMVSGQMEQAKEKEAFEDHRAEQALAERDMRAEEAGGRPRSDSIAPPPGISLESLASGNLKIDEILAHKKRVTEQKLRLRALEEEAPGGLYIQGSNERGQAGQLGDVEFVATFSYLRPLIRETVVQVACGFEHTLVRTSNEQVFFFGKNSYGQGGLGDTVDRDQPYSLHYRGAVLAGHRAMWVAAYEKTSAVLTVDGEVFTMGSIATGSLGHGDPDSEDPLKQLALLPTPVPELHLKTIRRVSLGAHHGAAVTKAGRLYVWGRNSCGQLGNGDFVDQLRPALIKGFGEFFAEVACGEEHTAAIGFDGNCHMWGSNRNGQLGFQSSPTWNSPQSAPRACMSLFRKGVHKLSCGRHHTVAVTEDGEAFATHIVDDARLVDRVKFHRLHPNLHLKDAVATPVDSTVTIDLQGVLYRYEPNQFDEPRADDTLETRHLHELSAGLEHVALVGTIDQRWRIQAQEAYEKAIADAEAAAALKK